MPHLAPLSWVGGFMVFWVFIFSMLAAMWWQQSVSFKPCVVGGGRAVVAWNWG